MKYKGYEAVIEYDEIDRLFFGRVINTRDVISFDGTTRFSHKIRDRINQKLYQI